jgi:hypothetical protein
MKPNVRRPVLALASSLLWLGSSALADELRFSDMEVRLVSMDEGDTESDTIQSAALLADSQSVESLPPMELGDETAGKPLDDGKCACGKSGCIKCCTAPPPTGVYHAEVQLYWMRAHVLESSVGKLSEKYELSPRFIVGYEDAGGVGGRARYWTYGRWTPNLGGGDEIRFEMNVIDAEVTSRFRTARADLIVAAGFRWADVEIVLGDDAVSADMPGFTFAADLRTSMCRDRCSEWAAIGGARWSILGGDWEGDGGFLEPVRDDNVVVQELYLGAEYIRSYRDYDLYGRLKFELQNWHSDAAAQGAGTDSISFVGPGVEFGMMF